MGLHLAVSGATYEWTTLAGNTGGAGSTDGPLAIAHFTTPIGIASDADDNLYVADLNSTIRKITASGVVSTLAGTPFIDGSANGTGASALFNRPEGIAVDGSGNVFVADTQNHIIRKITSEGAVTTLAGRAGQSGISDGAGINARFKSPADLAVNSDGIIYVADQGNHTIRKVTPTGTVTTLAGTPGTEGSTDSTGTLAGFRGPAGVTVDSSGTIYVADTLNSTIRKVTPAGAVTTIVGTAGASGSADGARTVARLWLPTRLKIDAAGNLFFADYGSHTIRKATLAGAVTTLAGTAYEAGFVNATGGAARFERPGGVALDLAGNVLVPDSTNNAIRKVTLARVVTTLAGGPLRSGTANGTGAAARFDHPSGVAVDSGGIVYVADTWNNTIRKINPAGTVSAVAGTPGVAGSLDGAGTVATFREPRGLAVYGDGTVFVAERGSHIIRKITPNRVVSTLAGTPGQSGASDGIGTAASFYSPTAVALDDAGVICVANTGRHTIRKVTSLGVVTTFAGSSGQAGSIDASGLAAKFHSPQGVGVGADGNIYVADTLNQQIRRITPDRVVTTFAGSKGTQGSVDGIGSAALFNTPVAIAGDSQGNIYVCEQESSVIRQITPAGMVTTIGGLAYSRRIGDGIGSVARFQRPLGIASTPAGVIYVADTENHRIVRGIPLEPVALAQKLSTVEDTPKQITLSGFDAADDPLTFAIVSPPAHGILTLTGVDALYTPGANFAGPDSFTFKANDGTTDSVPSTISISVTAVNDAPRFTAPLPDVNAGGAAPDVEFDLRPLMNDLDEGDTHTWRIAAVSNPSIFAAVKVIDGKLTVSYAPYYSGVSNVTVEVRDAAGEIAQMTFVATLPTLPTPEVTVSGALELNQTTGLWEQSVTVKNTALRAIGGFEVTVSGLPADASLFNASDALNGDPVAGYYRPLNPGESVTVVLEYYSLSPGAELHPLISTSVALPQAPPPGAPGGLAVDRVVALPDNAILIEFTTTNDHHYLVQYSDDATQWDSRLPIRAAGNRIQWIDRGPPRTGSIPVPGSRRFYRVKDLTP